MRILLSCLQSLKAHAIPACSFWRSYFAQGMLEAGHEVLEVPDVDWAEGFTYPRGSALESWRARTWEAVESFVRREHAKRPIDLFIGYLYPKQVDETAIQELQRSGIPCVNFFCDNVRAFAKVPCEYRPFALHWVPEFDALGMYRKAGLQHIHAPMPCWFPAELRDAPRIETELPTFIGSADILRRDLLARAMQDGGDFVVKGCGWIANSDPAYELQQTRSATGVIRNQIELVRERGLSSLLNKIEARVRPLRPPSIHQSRIGGTLSNTEYIRVTREAMVTIGVNRVLSANCSLRRPLVYSRLRDIEAPMLGACYLTEWTEGLEHMYELGTEIETYRTAEELSSKLKSLRSDPARRATMRQRAQRRALCDHNVPRSITRIAAQLGLRCA